MESREPAPQASQSVLDDHVYEVAGNDNQEVYEEITLHIGRQSMVPTKVIEWEVIIQHTVT